MFPKCNIIQSASNELIHAFFSAMIGWKERQNDKDFSNNFHWTQPKSIGNNLFLIFQFKTEQIIYLNIDSQEQCVCRLTILSNPLCASRGLVSDGQYYVLNPYLRDLDLPWLYKEKARCKICSQYIIDKVNVHTLKDTQNGYILRQIFSYLLWMTYVSALITRY